MREKKLFEENMKQKFRLHLTENVKKKNKTELANYHMANIFSSCFRRHLFWIMNYKYLRESKHVSIPFSINVISEGISDDFNFNTESSMSRKNNVFSSPSFVLCLAHIHSVSLRAIHVLCLFWEAFDRNLVTRRSFSIETSVSNEKKKWTAEDNRIVYSFVFRFTLFFWEKTRRRRVRRRTDFSFISVCL